MPDVIPTFLRREEFERGGDKCEYLIERSWSRGPEEGFKFGECLFDRIEVGAVGWQKSDQRADRLDSRTDLRLFVDGEVIEDDDVAGAQSRDEDLLDIRTEADGVDRAIKDRWCADAIDP